MTLAFAVLLLLGVAAGPHGLGVVTPQLVGLLDPGVAVAAAMIGAFVGLAIAAGERSRLVPTVLLVLGGALSVAAFRAESVVGAIGLVGALGAISAGVAVAGWFLVGQASSDAEQHACIAGILLLVGGAATYLSLSAVFAGFIAGAAWSLAGDLAKARISRDLDYFQHPFIVLALFAAGATAPMSLDGLIVAVVLGLALLIARALTKRPVPRSLADETSPATPIGLVAVALALDLSRSDASPEWALTLLGGTVIAAFAAGLVSSTRMGST